jgi:murein DD-endopeptidase MepM/ murein hydrolase activator NlpD
MQLFLREKNKYSSISKRIISWSLVFAVTLTTIGMYSGTAYAGLFSFVGSIFEGSSVAAKTITTNTQDQNLQTITLLQAPVNINPNQNIIADIAPINNDEMLVADLAGVSTADENNYNTQISTYVVREGDTISSVSRMFNVSVNTILWTNNLNSRSILKVGQTLTILPVTGISYIVKKGDTIRSIASKYNADITDILNYNDITISTPLSVGNSIIIPDVELSATEIAQSTVISTNRVISGFIRPIVGGRKTQGIHGHNAVDLAAPIGTPIIASASGIVIISRTGGWNGGYGNYVVISHSNGTQTLYGHTFKNLVSAGERVVQGQTIALLGSTGNSTGPHVHFEIRGAVNPF